MSVDSLVNLRRGIETVKGDRLRLKEPQAERIFGNITKEKNLSQQLKVRCSTDNRSEIAKGPAELSVLCA